ncbi:MAG: S-layer homology domain-containing protein [Oscillospiraceae bacterium]|nr:S-layer homology domain-containing protein [Oscillospiraceae bacterium]
MKKHTLIKIASMAMAVTMLASTGAGTMMTAFAQTAKTTVTESQKQEKMKAALTKVKKRFTVPSHVSEFTYRTNNDFSTDCFYFTWTTPTDAKVSERYNAVIIGDVIVYYNYRKNGSSDYKQSFAKLTDEQLMSKAKAHLKKLNPDVYTDGIYTITGIELFGENAYVQFQRKENGVIVDGNGFTLTLDKNTGELYSMEGEWWQNVSFKDASSRLSEEEAIEAFEKLCTLTPAYSVTYDWETKEYTARLVYRPDFTDEIDAFTGKASTIWEDMKKDKGTRYNPHGYGYTAALANGLGSDAGAVTEEACEDEVAVEFTEAELKEIEADKSLLTKEQLTKLLQDNKYIGLYNKAELKSSYLQKDEESGEYYYTLRYASGNGGSVVVPYNGYYEEEVAEEVEEVDAEDDSVVKKEKDYSANFYLNAKTGRIENFSQSVINDLSDKNPYPVKTNLERAKAAIKNFYPDIYSEYRSAAENSKESEFWTETKTGIKHYESTRTFTFKRYVNNVVVEGDTISVTMANDGQITNVRYNYVDVEFPSVPKFDKEKAFEELFRQQDMKLYYDGYYKPDGTMKTYLIYKTASFTLDRNYKLCGYNGQELTKAEYTDTNYTDISGHKYEKAITTLARYGITLDSESRKFNPDGTLTDEEFGQIVYQAMQGYRPYAIKNSNDERKPLTLTNALAAKVFVSASNGDKFAELKGIFKSPYSDVSDDSEYVGYIAMAKAMGLMSVSGDKFYPNGKVTRGAAMQLIYNYIVSLEK